MRRIAVVATAALWLGQGPVVFAGEPPDAWSLQRARQSGPASPLTECRHCVKQFPNSNVPVSRQSAQGLTVSTAGTNRIPVLLVDFNDEAGQKTANEFDALLFSTAASDGTNSMAEYYTEVSYGQFTVAGAVYPTSGWYRAANPSTNYAGGLGGVGDTYPSNAQALVEEVVQTADPDVDFSQFDNNGDGFVDSVIVVFSGYKASATGDTDHDFWPHQYRLTGGSGPGPLTVDGVQVNTYMLVNELHSSFGVFNNQLAKVGVFCHEYGHVLGLPDLYSTDFDNVYDEHWGLGQFGLMAYGHVPSPARPTHMSAWSKIQLGWVTPTDVMGLLSNEMIDKAEAAGPGVYRLWTVGAPTTEYFLVEYRKKEGFDESLPGCGLVVYHVDESVRTGDFDDDGTINVFDNDLQWDETNKFIDVEAANQTGNDHTLDADFLDDRSSSPFNISVAQHAFFTSDTASDPDRDTFNSTSMPSSISYAAQTTSVAVTSIGSCGGDFVIADLDVGTLPSPNIDLWVNDCAADVGVETSTPPCSAWWVSTDIYLDNDLDGIQDQPVYNQPNRLFARVHNLGTTPAVNVIVDFYYANNSTGLNFPGNGTLIDSVTLPLIAGGERVVASAVWTIPSPPGNGHYCIGVVASHADDAPASEVLNLENNLGGVNIGQLFSRAGDGAPDAPGGSLLGEPVIADFDIENPTDQDDLVVRLFAEMELPEGWTLQFQDLIFGTVWATPDSPPLNPTLPPHSVRPIRMTLLPPATVFHGATGMVRVIQYDASQYQIPSGQMGGIDFPFTVDGHRPGFIADLSITTVTHIPEPDDIEPVPGATPVVRLDFQPVDTDLFDLPDEITHYNLYRSTTQDFVVGAASLYAQVLRDASPVRAGWQYYDTNPQGGPHYYVATVVDAAGYESVFKPRVFVGRTGTDISVSWSPYTPGAVLQESGGWTNGATSWVNLPSGTNNPATVPASGSSGFYRTGTTAAPPSD